MYCEDLTPYHYYFTTGLPGTLNIGWLCKSSTFPTGNVSPDILRLIEHLAQRPTLLTRGYHRCEFCDIAESASGNGEIWLREPGGPIYVAPALLSHYVGKHRYLPPAPFRQLLESDYEIVKEGEIDDLMKSQAERLKNNPTRADILVPNYSMEVFWRLERFSDLVAFKGHLTEMRLHSIGVSLNSLAKTNEGFSLNIEMRDPAAQFAGIVDCHEIPALRPYMYRYRMVYLCEPWTVVEL